MVIIIIEVNVSEIGNNILELSSLIDEYEDIKLNLFEQLKDSVINWRDGNSIKFDNEVYLDKQESELFLESLKKKKEVFDYIYSKYSEIAKKIKCNLDNKSSLLGSLDNCYNKASEVINSFNNIDRSFYYSEVYSINLQKDVIVGVRNKISNMKNAVNNLFKKIDEIEKEVDRKIEELEQIKINEFDFFLEG